jgi:hypothetical protein
VARPASLRTGVAWSIFDRAQPSLELVDTAPLTLADPVVHEAAELVGLAL